MTRKDAFPAAIILTACTLYYDGVTALAVFAVVAGGVMAVRLRLGEPGGK